MSDLSAAAQSLGVPEPIVRRSAEARAAASGLGVDEVLAAWAGGGGMPAAPPPTEAPPARPEADREPAVAAAPAEAAAPEAEPGTEPTPEPAVARAQPLVVTRAPGPAQVTPAEAAAVPEVVTVPTAGIRERTSFAVPGWMTALLLLVPAFALFALTGSATGTCGEGTELTFDVITGDIVNCDGSEFTGSGVGGGGGADFIAEGQALYAGAPNCHGCHGANGEGGVAPPMGRVITTFGSCDDHVAWVVLGSSGFRAEGRNTYGDTGQAIAGGMPGFQATLTEEQIRAVTAFERVRFGGADREQTLVECGLAEPEGEEPPAEGEPGEETEPGGDQPVEPPAPGTEAGTSRAP